MTYRIVESPRARIDVNRIVAWLVDRSRSGALKWLVAYQKMVARLRISAESFPIASDVEDDEYYVREALFKTPHGETYRAIFLIEDAAVHIMRVIGPGQNFTSLGDRIP